ncbi:MAG: hypothetical protein Q9169_008735, partial [Polycauliona sp. 2 TL-2023]
MRSWEGPYSQQSVPEQQQQQYQYHSSHPHIQAHRQQQHQPQSQPQPQRQPAQPKPHKIDLLISELLGSFADNELSPECLDPLTTHLLNPTHGISIPASYTSYLTPIAAPKLHADIASRTPGDPKAAHTPYVVMLHAIDYLSTLPSENPSEAGEPIIKEAWGFAHGSAASHSSAAAASSSSKDSDYESPSKSPITHNSKPDTTTQHNNKHNTRAARLTFPIPHRGCMHGIAG